MNSIKVQAPASSANLGPGFDVFGIALREPVDMIEVTEEEGDGIFIVNKSKITTPVSVESNAAGVVANKLLNDFGFKRSLTIKIHKGIKPGIGLGSSAASSVATVLAINELLGLKLQQWQIIRYSSYGEAACSGVAHTDNVAASLLGGFIVVKGERAFSLKPPANIAVCIATPSISLPERKTEYARSILPKHVELDKVVNNVANASLILAGFAMHDITLIGKGMNDEIIEPVRRRLIKGYEDVKKAALDSGAAGVCISGAGPSMLAIVDSSIYSPRNVTDCMVEAFGRNGVTAEGFYTRIGKGAEIVRQ
ncbi:MAG: homoserine kinase [Conexivisphaerales archaeon]